MGEEDECVPGAGAGLAKFERCIHPPEQLRALPFKAEICEAQVNEHHFKTQTKGISKGKAEIIHCRETVLGHCLPSAFMGWTGLYGDIGLFPNTGCHHFSNKVFQHCFQTSDSPLKTARRP